MLPIKFFTQPFNLLCSRIVLFFFKTQVKTINMPSSINLAGNLFVCNHLSYFDVLVLNSIYKSSFITSIEIKNTLLLGQLAQLGGCIFVERRNKNNLGIELENVSKALRTGSNITIFPEATSTNGESVLQFKKAFFHSAIEARSFIYPITINYKINGNYLNISNRDQVCWYGKMTFFSHLKKLVSIKSIEAEVIFHSEIFAHNNNPPEYYANKTHDIILQSFQKTSH